MGKRSADENRVAGTIALLPPLSGSYIAPGVSLDIPTMAVSEPDAAPALNEQLSESYRQRYLLGDERWGSRAGFTYT